MFLEVNKVKPILANSSMPKYKGQNYQIYPIEQLSTELMQV